MSTETNLAKDLWEARMRDDFNLLHCMMHRGATAEEITKMCKYLATRYDADTDASIAEFYKKYASVKGDH